MAAASLRLLSPRCFMFILVSPLIGRNRSPPPVRPSRVRSIPMISQLSTSAPAEAKPREPQIAGMEEALTGLVTGKMKATEVAHLVWRNIIQKGDTVVDATCGNGFDTLALLKMVADNSGCGCVYGMDIQDTALDSTSSLLDRSVGDDERKLVKLFKHCHSKMEDIIPKEIPVRLVAFNLGYLPGGDKKVITTSGTTLSALEAASRILSSGGLISILVYVGHPGGREELQSVESFASSLSVETWVSSKYEMLNRTGPVLILIFKR